MKFNKYENNPILLPVKEHQWENFCVLNPGVIYDDKTGRFVMLYRAAGDDIKHKICLGLATSTDGFNFTRCSDQPAFNPPEEDIDGGFVRGAFGDLFDRRFDRLRQERSDHRAHAADAAERRRQIRFARVLRQ